MAKHHCTGRAAQNAVETAVVLLGQGANINAKDNDGKTPLHWVVLMRYDDADEMAMVLLEQGANINAKDNNGSTPLHVAVGFNANEMAMVLLEQGANVNAKDNDGWTPLFRATATLTEDPDKREMASLLRRYGGRR